MPAELAGVSVKDLVKAIGESRANGNGVTPPGTRSSSPRLSRSSSPVAIPGKLINLKKKLVYDIKKFLELIN